MHKLLQLKKNQCTSYYSSKRINASAWRDHQSSTHTRPTASQVKLFKYIWLLRPCTSLFCDDTDTGKASSQHLSFFFPSWWVTIQLVKLMSLTDYSSVPLSFTHINNKKNQWITRPHNIQKSLNKTNISVCITTTSCLPPIWSSRPALFLTGCGFLRMTRAQYHAQESEYENTPPCIRGSGMLLSQLPLIHSQP